MFCITGNLTSEPITWQPEAICICNLCLNSLYTTIVEMAWWVKNFWSEINRIVSCIGWLFQCDQDILVSSSPPTSRPCLSYSSPSILLLLSIVFFSSWCLILLSSFAPLLRGAALLSIFIMRPGKKADRNRRETSSRSSPHSRLSESSWFQNASFSSIFNESSSVSRCFPKRFHSVLFDPLHLFLYLNFYFRLFFFFLQLRPDSFSLTPPTICSSSSLIMALFSSLVFTGQSEEVHGPHPAQSGGQSVQVFGKRLRSQLPRRWHWW